MASQFKTFVAGDVLTAAEVNGYLMKQAVIVCDSSSDYPGSPVEGMTVYDKALDTYLGYTGSGWVRLAGLTSSAIDTWAPTVTQSGSVSATATEARYLRSGPVVEAWLYLSITGSGTANNVVTVTLPVTASGHTNGTVIGGGLIIDTSAPNIYTVAVQQESTTTCSFRATVSASSSWGQAPNLALASGDSIRVHMRYTV